MADADRLAPFIERLKETAVGGAVPVTLELMTDMVEYIRELEDHKRRAQESARIDAQLINHFRRRVLKLALDADRLDWMANQKVDLRHVIDMMMRVDGKPDDTPT